MKETLQFLWKKKVFAFAGMVFLCVTLLMLAVVLYGPLMTESYSLHRYTDVSTLKMWTFILLPPTIIALSSGSMLALFTLWKRPRTRFGRHDPIEWN